jgi:exopolysaccharide production protein ExoQ
LKCHQILEKPARKNFIFYLKTLGVIFLFLVTDNLLLSTERASIVNLITYSITALLLVGNVQKIFNLFRKDTPLFVLLLIAVASTLWSTNPLHTLDILKGLILATIIGLYVSSFYSVKQQINIVIWQSILGLILSLLVVLYFPHAGIKMDGMWNGIYGHKQNLGRVMAFGAGTFFCVFLQQKSRRTLAIIGYISCFILLIFSQSKTALLIVLSYPIIFGFYKIIIRYYKLRIIFLMLFVLFCFGSCLLFYFNSDYILVDLLGKDAELNGRTPLWKLSIEKGLEHFWLGYGYDAFWTSDEAYNILDNVWAGVRLTTLNIVFHAHNGYIDLFLQLGAIGLVAFMWHFTTLFTRVLTLAQFTKNLDYFWIFLFLVIATINNSSNFITFLAPKDYFWILYVSFSVLTAKDLERVKKEKNIDNFTRKNSNSQSSKYFA